jgi:lipopolysaccharide/colanic/teichoic acid biosynthesis glycosyltransferase
MSKRIFDIFFSIIGLCFIGPIIVILAIAIKADSPGPIFYRGERVGRKGRLFRILKFRTMHINAEKLGGTTTSKSDPRITCIGRLIRKFKLDEFPQLINILRGEMSIVGPRPQVKWAVDLFSEEERLILNLRPGITDWASLLFHNEEEIISRSGISDPDQAYMKLIHPVKTKLQLHYYFNHNLVIDLRIIFSTLLTLMSTRLGGKPFGIPQEIKKIAEHI